jgi:hypothetical protein
MTQAIRNRTASDRNFLLWGPSGCGKSHLVSEIKRDLSLTKYKLEDINLADAHWSLMNLRRRLHRLRRKCELSLIFFDEVDSAADPDTELTIFDCLRWSGRRKGGTARPAVILAGSVGTGIRDLCRLLRKGGKKGMDLLNKVPESHLIEIPPYDAYDRLVVYIGCCVAVAKSLRFRLRGIEKRAAFLLCLHPSSDATHRMMSTLKVEEILSKTNQEGSKVLKMTHILASKDQTFLRLAEEHRWALDGLAGDVIGIRER